MREVKRVGEVREDIRDLPLHSSGRHPCLIGMRGEVRQGIRDFPLHSSGEQDSNITIELMYVLCLSGSRV